MKDTFILAIESSCDETAASVVKNGRTILSNVISSQIALHTLYGGVVPEIASRKHIEKINQVIEEALSEANVTLDDLDAIGVTYGPGLVGALLVGVAAVSYTHLHTVLSKFTLDAVSRTAHSGSVRAAALDHEAVDNTVENKSVIKSLFNKADKVIYSIWCNLRI